MNIELIIWSALGIVAIIGFIVLIWWAERDIKKHPEMVGKRDKNDILSKIH